MPESLLERAGAAVDLARKAGAQDVFAHATWSRSVNCDVRDRKLEKLQENVERGLHLDLYVDGRYSSHRTTDLRTKELSQFVADAVALTRMLEPDPHRRLPDPSLYPSVQPAGLDLVDPSIVSRTREERVDSCQRCNQQMAGKDGVLSATSSVSDQFFEIAAVTSNGFAGQYRATAAGIYATATLKDEGDSRPEESFWTSARHREMLTEPEAVGDEALARARRRLGTKKGPTMVTTLVVDRLAGSGLVWRLLSPAEGQAIQQKRSMWAGQVGKRRVSRKLTITNDPTIPGALGSQPFDNEGLRAVSMPIFEAGVLRNYFLNTYYASKLAMKATTGSWSNIVVTSGKRSLEQIVADIPKGIYVTSWLGGNADRTTGDFSLGLRGHFIEKGRIGAPIGEMNVTGNLVALFDHLVEVGGDPWTQSSIRVPTLVFEKVQFSGT